MKEINNALAPHEFEELQKYIMGHEIPWYHYEHLTYPPTLPEFNENHDKKRTACRGGKMRGRTPRAGGGGERGEGVQWAGNGGC